MAMELLDRARESATHKQHGDLRRSQRYLSVASGAGLLLGSLARRPTSRSALLAAGGYLLYRGLTGRCPLSERLGTWRAAQRKSAPQRSSAEECELFTTHTGLTAVQASADWQPPNDHDGVDEADVESFPASDPPAYSGAAATPSNDTEAPRGQR